MNSLAPIRLYLDEDAMSRALMQGLRARGVDVTTVFEAGMVGRSDEAQLEYAAALGRVIITFNVGDFCKLHGDYLAAGVGHGGIIVAHRQRYSVGEQVRRLLKLVESEEADDLKNRLIFL